jgi:hypothetical protein
MSVSAVASGHVNPVMQRPPASAARAHDSDGDNDGSGAAAAPIASSRLNSSGQAIGAIINVKA